MNTTNEHPTTVAAPIARSTLSLRTKLVLSYVAVILGTVLILSFVVSQAAQAFFINVQTSGLRASALSTARSLLFTYQRSQGNWSYMADHLPPSSTNYILVATDGTGSPHICIEPSATRDCEDPTVVQAISQTLQTQQEVDGTISISTGNGTITSVYASIPLKFDDGPTIGAMILSEPLLSGEFMQQTNQAIFVTGIAVALIALLCSFLLIRRLTRPLGSLTEAAEKMKKGEYTQRVKLPARLDELGELALTFNEMASTIEKDINELRHQDQLRRELVANIAHDLATPLTAIQGLSEALAEDVITDPAARQETGQRISREIRRLHRLIADVRQVSSLEAGHTQLDLAPLDMHELVDETIAVIEPECEQMGLTVRNDIAADTPPAYADSDRITEVLLNLLDNARRHTPAGGQIHINAHTQGSRLHVWVSDTGTGIDSEVLPHIFERFYRADRARTNTTGGSGLGLSIVKAIITAHGGSVWAESTLGQGTRINFVLPTAASMEVQPAHTQTQTTPPTVATGTLPPQTADYGHSMQNT